VLQSASGENFPRGASGQYTRDDNVRDMRAWLPCGNFAAAKGKYR
jgi:hypothetical protein